MSIYFQKTYQRSFGTFPLHGEELASAIKHAVDTGYRSFDTAQMYKNETDVGAALSTIDVKREDLCITTKVHPDNFSADKFLPSVEQSLKALKLDYVDGLLLHWPPLDSNIVPSLKLLAKAKKLGLASHIGVSNYTAQMMRGALSIIDEALVINQVEFHPLLNQDILLQAAVDTGIPLASYCSVARGEVFKHPVFADIGKAYDKTAAQIVLRWILQKGVPINTMSVKPENIRANFAVMDFTLSSGDMAKINAMTTTGFRVVGKNLVPWAPDWD